MTQGHLDIVDAGVSLLRCSQKADNDESPGNCSAMRMRLGAE